MLDYYISLYPQEEPHRHLNKAKDQAYQELTKRMRVLDGFHFKDANTTADLLRAQKEIKKMIKARLQKIRKRALHQVAPNVRELQKNFKTEIIHSK